MPDEEIEEIEVIDDTPEEDQGRAPVNETFLEQQIIAAEANSEGRRVNPETKQVEVTKPIPEEYQQRFKVLKFKAEHERREKEARERELAATAEYTRSLKARADELAQRVQQLEGGWKQEAVGRRTSEFDRAKADLTAAIEAADPVKQAEAHERMALLAQDKRAAEAFQPRDYSQFVPQPPPPGPPPVAQKAIEWAADPANSWFRDNPVMRDTAVKISEYLQSTGIEPDNDDHYSKLNAEMQKRFPAAFGLSVEPQKKNGAPVAAAPRVNGSSQAPRKAQLTASQVKMAERLGLTKEQFYASYRQLSSPKV